MDYTYIGKKVPKIDALGKLTGDARYVHDLKLPRMLYGKILRSKYAHARILNIDTRKAKRSKGVKAVLTWEDTPKIKFGFVKDNFPLKGDKVRSRRDEVAAVAAIDPDIAAEALELIRVEYEELPGIFSLEEARRQGAPEIHEGIEGNTITSLPYNFQSGQPEQAMAEADCMVNATFNLPFVTHCCLGTLACIAAYDEAGRLTMWTTTQVPFLYQRELADALGMKGEQVRVIQPPIGGGFGRGLDVYPFEPVCAILSRKAGRPVKIAFDREEEFNASPTRQPCLIEMKTGAKKDGTLLARQAHVFMDCGAYISWGATTPLVMMATATSLYIVPHIKFETTLVYTNNPYSGAMRGYGNPQISFALESQMDMLADELKIDPVELRLKNCNFPGQVTPQQFKITTCGLRECIEKARDAIGWKEKRGHRKGRGVGLAGMTHVGGGARVYRSDGCGTLVKADDFGKVTVITGSTEIGQGTDTAIALIVAEELSVPLDRITVINSDTDIKPWDVGTHASRATFIAGNSARLAAADAQRQILEEASSLLEARPDDLEIKDGRIFVRGSPDRNLPYEKVLRARHFRAAGNLVIGRGFYDPPTEMQDSNYLGNISATYSFGAHAAEVEVDIETGIVTVLNFVAAHDVGRAINLLGVEGSIQGGVHMGLGYALSEELILDKGEVLNPSFEDYRLLTCKDMPPIKIFLIETDDPAGPFGAKGLGEAGAIPVAPAVANAIYDAIGVRLTQLPMTPERVVAALKKGE